MNILAFDTCLGALSVAVARAEGSSVSVIEELAETVAATHAERLVPMIEAALRRAGLRFADLDRVAVTLGPGTFTGVRTGIAAARAFRLASGVAVVGTTSLAVIAHRVLVERGAGTEVLVAADARRGQHFVQLFRESALAPVSPPQELTAEAAAATSRDGTIIAGSGAQAVAQAAQAMSKGVEILAGAADPRAGDLARLAAHLDPLERATPLYIRPPDAKPQTNKSIARAP